MTGNMILPSQTLGWYAHLAILFLLLAAVLHDERIGRRMERRLNNAEFVFADHRDCITVDYDFECGYIRDLILER